jgi:hypothetical protein
MRVALTFVLLLATTACATVEPDIEREPKVVCAMEVPTGSQLRVRRCRTTEEVASNQKEAEDIKRANDRVRPRERETR